MPYTNTVTLLDTEGGEALDAPVTARLWMLWTVVGTPTGPDHMQDERESQNLQLRKDLSAPATISFNQDADFTSVSRFSGISIQDTNRVGQDIGWLFRSGPSDGPVSTQPIEIIAGRIDILAADVPGLLPALPIALDTDTSVTALTATLGAGTAGGPGGGIDFIATGTTTKPGDAVGFTYTGRLVLFPSPDVAAAESEAIGIGIANPGLVFTPGATIVSAFEAAVLNLLRPFILREFGPQIRTNLEQRLNAAVIASAGRSLPGGVLPAGVTISIRTIDVNPARIQIRAALGAFGGVFSKLPPPPAGGGGTRICPGQTLATLGHALTGLALLREVRDVRLAASDSGRRLIECYYRCGEEVSELLRADPGLAQRAAQVADDLAVALGRGMPVPDALRRRAEGLLHELAGLGSPELRASAAYALELRPWRLL